MSLFPEYELAARLYDFVDSGSTKITTIDVDTDPYTEITINVIRLGDTDALIQGDVLGEYTANISTSAERGQLVYIPSTGDKFHVVKKPRYNKLFEKYHVNLKPIDRS